MIKKLLKQYKSKLINDKNLKYWNNENLND